jgi:hypothetical protein
MRYGICVAAASVVLLTNFAHSQQAPGEQATIEKDVEGTLRVNNATAYLNAADAAAVSLSSTHYRVIKAVEHYRDSVQKKLLSATEREFRNFDIHIEALKDLGKNEWLNEQEKASCYLVYLFPRPEPNEETFLHRSPKAGRIAKYAVRRTDFAIVRGALVESFKH